MTKLEPALLLKLQERDPKTLSETVHKYTRHIYNACLGLGFSEPEADDLTQGVWLTFFDVVAKFEGRSTLRTFLFGILYNKVSEFRRSNKRLEPTEDIEFSMDQYFDREGHWIKSPIDPERFMISSQTMDLIARCLERLPLNQKMAFAMKEVEDQSSEEICQTMGLSVSNLGVLLFRARNQLRQCIEKKTGVGV